MKINKIIVLVLLISLLALAVASQISELNFNKITQATDKISVEEVQDCAITYYNATEGIYGNVTRARNTYGTCLNPINLSYYTCANGTESYQSYEVIGSQIVLRNNSDCVSRNSYIISVNKNGLTTKNQIDFSEWGPCIYNVENSCLVVTCVSLYDGAHNGQFTNCNGGKSCQKFEICEDSIRAFYKNSRDNFAEEDPSFYLGRLALKEVGR